jgi:hypothetical protein
MIMIVIIITLPIRPNFPHFSDVGEIAFLFLKVMHHYSTTISFLLFHKNATFSIAVALFHPLFYLQSKLTNLVQNSREWKDYY